MKWLSTRTNDNDKLRFFTAWIILQTLPQDDLGIAPKCFSAVRWVEFLSASRRIKSTWSSSCYATSHTHTHTPLFPLRVRWQEGSGVAQHLRVGSAAFPEDVSAGFLYPNNRPLYPQTTDIHTVCGSALKTADERRKFLFTLKHTLTSCTLLFWNVTQFVAIIIIISILVFVILFHFIHHFDLFSVGNLWCSLFWEQILRGSSGWEHQLNN